MESRGLGVLLLCTCVVSLTTVSEVVWGGTNTTFETTLALQTQLLPAGKDGGGVVISRGMGLSVLRMEPCSTYRVTLQNDLVGRAAPGSAFFSGAARARDPDVGSLHARGLHVSQDVGANDVLAAVAPLTSGNYTYAIPCDHLGGVALLQPHPAVSGVSLVGGGAFAVVIVEDVISANISSQVLDMPEVIVVLHFLDPRLLAALAYATGDDVFSTDTTEAVYLVNGEVRPSIDLNLGEWVRFRFVHVSLATHAQVYIGDETGQSVPACDLELLSKDGVWLMEAPRTVDALELFEGSRADVAIRCTSEAPSGSVHLWARSSTRSSVTEEEVSDEVLADFVFAPATGSGVTGALDLFTPCFPWYVTDLRDAALLARGETVSSQSNSPDLVHITRSSVDRGRLHLSNEGDAIVDPFGGHQGYAISRHLRAGAIYEWEVHLDENVVQRSFHIPAFPFQLQGFNSTSGYFEDGDWHDTMFAGEDGVLPIRLRVTRYSGPIVVTGGVLPDERKGAMNVFLAHGGSEDLGSLNSVCVPGGPTVIPSTDSCNCDAECAFIGDCCAGCFHTDIFAGLTCGDGNYTWTSLAGQVHRGNLLVVVESLVYNITDYADNHPSGRASLEGMAGHDATALFASIAAHVPVDLLSFLPCLGVVEGSDPGRYQPPELRDEAREDPFGGTLYGDDLGSGYDFVIVGTGPAAAALAWQLTSDDAVTVLMVEEGDWVELPEQTPSFVLAEWEAELLNPTTRRPMRTEAIPGFDGREQDILAGKGTGGSTVAGPGLLHHPHPADFDAWAALGLPTWSWSNMSTFSAVVHQLYRAVLNEDTLHYPYLDELSTACSDAFTPVLRASPSTQKGCHLRRFLASRTWTWVERPDGYGSGSASDEAAGPLGWWMKRDTAHTLWLEAVLSSRPGLKILTGVRVERVLLDEDNTTALGVVVNDVRQPRAEPMHIMAGKEVVLSAGVYGSPKLLLLSGIGPAADVEAAGVAARVDLPEVGATLTDDGYCELTGPLLRADLQPSPGVQWDYAAVSAMWPSQGVEVLGPDDGDDSVPPRWAISLYVGTNEGVNMSSVDEVSVKARIRPLGMTGHSGVSNPVRLASSLPSDPPIIDPAGALASADDQAKWLEAAWAAYELFNASMVRDLLAGGGALAPGQSVWNSGDAAVLAWVRANCQWSCGNAQGTNPMGEVDSSVVDEELRVHGMDGLRVVDASVFPTHMHGGPASSAVLLGLRAGELLLLEHSTGEEEEEEEEEPPATNGTDTNGTESTGGSTGNATTAGSAPATSEAEDALLEVDVTTPAYQFAIILLFACVFGAIVRHALGLLIPFCLKSARKQKTKSSSSKSASSGDTASSASRGEGTSSDDGSNSSAGGASSDENNSESKSASQPHVSFADVESGSKYSDNTEEGSWARGEARREERSRSRSRASSRGPPPPSPDRSRSRSRSRALLSSDSY